MTEPIREPIWTRCAEGHTPRDRKNQRRFMLFSFIWAVCFVGATWLVRSETVSAGPAGWAVAALPAAAAIFAALAYARFLREADELHRRIELGALALAVGAAFVAWPTYRLIGRLDFPVDKWGELPFLIMIAGYCVGILFGRSKYS